MPRKQKLTPAERSQVAKDRWAKRRANRVSVVETVLSTMVPIYTPNIATSPVVSIQQEMPIDEAKQQFNVTPPVAPKKPKTKKVPVPKEFLLALKTADQLLAKALEEYEHCEERITYLRKAIPRLQRTVQSLRSESNPDAQPNTVASYDFSGPLTAQTFSSPLSQPFTPAPNLAAIQAAMAQPPVSRAVGNAMQFTPADTGTMEGPDDDDNEDKFLTGPMATGTWI